MRFMPTPTQLDAMLRRGTWGIIFGFPVLCAVIVLGHGPVVAPMMATALGATCASFSVWRTERGLWMLGVVFLLGWGPIYLGFAYAELFGGGSGDLSIGAWLDFSCGTVVLGYLCRVLFAASVHNWRVGRGGSFERHCGDARRGA